MLEVGRLIAFRTDTNATTAAIRSIEKSSPRSGSRPSHDRRRELEHDQDRVGDDRATQPRARGPGLVHQPSPRRQPPSARQRSSGAATMADREHPIRAERPSFIVPRPGLVGTKAGSQAKPPLPRGSEARTQRDAPRKPLLARLGDGRAPRDVGEPSVLGPLQLSNSSRDSLVALALAGDRAERTLAFPRARRTRSRIVRERRPAGGGFGRPGLDQGVLREGVAVLGEASISSEGLELQPAPPRRAAQARARFGSRRGAGHRAPVRPEAGLPLRPGPLRQAIPPSARERRRRVKLGSGVRSAFAPTSTAPSQVITTFASTSAERLAVVEVDRAWRRTIPSADRRDRLVQRIRPIASFSTSDARGSWRATKPPMIAPRNDQIGLDVAIDVHRARAAPRKSTTPRGAADQALISTRGRPACRLISRRFRARSKREHRVLGVTHRAPCPPSSERLLVHRGRGHHRVPPEDHRGAVGGAERIRLDRDRAGLGWGRA